MAVETSMSMYPGFDDKRNWGRPDLWRKPANVDVERWQQRINDICGTADGEPIIRLTWAWEPKEFFFTEWDSLGNGTKGETRPKYEFLTVPTGGKNYYICAPRWVLEERQPASVYQFDWENARWGIETTDIINPATGSVVTRRIDLRGPAPRGSGYHFVMYLAQHDEDGKCCKKAQGKHPCFGYYREPSDWMLNFLGKAAKDRAAAEVLADPNRPLAEQSDILARIEKETADHLAAKEARKDKDLDDIFRPFMNAHGWRAYATPKALAHGRYLDLKPRKMLIESTGEQNNASISSATTDGRTADLPVVSEPR
jgi:hypothetical protein